MRTLRASEIGLYLYCRRAWWYHRQGVESQNKTELAAGMTSHRQHGRQVLLSGLLRLGGWLLLLVALVMAAVLLTGIFYG